MYMKDNQNKEEWLNLLDNLFLELSADIKEKKVHFDEKGLAKPIKLNRLKVEEIRGILLEHGPKYLYKYREGTDKDLENLREDKMWMAIPSEFNDPFDCKVYVDCELVAKELIGNEAKLNLLMKTRGITEKDPIYIKFLNGVKMMENKLNEEITMKRDRSFIYCLSEKRNSQLMWSHYANNHKGFCIGYDFEKLLGLHNIDMLPVIYSKDFFVIDTLEKFKNHMDIFMKSVRRKSLDWSYEKEWRIFGEYKINESNQKGMISEMPIPFNIYMGCKIEKELENQIVDICKDKKINLYKM